MKLRIVFFGTPLFAAECLAYLLDHGADIVAVVTQPDRAKGRALQIGHSAVKTLLMQKAPRIPLFQPEKASDPSFLEVLATLQADLFVVVAYGQILSQKLLDIPPLGCINVHASLLPKFRGAAPIQRAIMAGEKETGLAIQKMVRQLDAGDVISVAKTPIGPDMTFGELEQKLIDLAKPLLLETLHLYETGIPPATPQNPAFATYASKVELAEGEVHWNRPASQLYSLIRAFSPRPGAWCWVSVGRDQKRLKILRAQMAPQKGDPGELLSSSGVVGCLEGALQLVEVQPEGKRPMSAADWLRGQKNISFTSMPK